MRATTKGIVLSVLVMSLSGAAYAQGAGAGGTGGAAGGGKGGAGMGTPNASGTTASPSAASGANTMGKSGDASQNQEKPKKEGMKPPASGSGVMKKAY